MTVDGERDELEALLAEQVAYYRAVAAEYGQSAIPDVSERELSAAHRETLAALAAFAPTGDVLELACGPGTWTVRLARHAATVTAVDAAPEMLAIAAANVGEEHVRFLRADLFEWKPDRRYDVVFFAFWLSHVPLEKFQSFWSLVADCLKPTGRVFFVDDGYRTSDELIDGEQSTTIRRRLADGTRFRAVKVPLRPAELEREVARLGWRITVTSMPGPFFVGAGSLR
jgi:demethylmenaquinone methyltransferase/2-methoxy-6-polyprenyl-1,4-benzoquinol methylase